MTVSAFVAPRGMPYGAPELKEAFRRYLVRGVLVGSAAWILLFLLGFGGQVWLRSRPHETKVIVVPFRELQAPPPLTDAAPPPQVAIQQPVAPPTVGVAVPVPDAEAPPEQTIASQEEIAQTTPGTGESQDIVVAPPSDDDLPKFGEFVYAEELPEVITKINPTYPEIAREAGVDGTVLLQALVDKEGKVRDVKVAKSIPMLDQSAVSAVKQWVFKPALSNNKPVAVWVAVPVRFTLH